jgi:hypothetical protein
MLMNTLSRREFVTYAGAASLASALPASAETRAGKTNKDRTTKPLVVDVIGPMAFRWGKSGFDVWMPDLHVTHEAGIMTPLTGFSLLQGDYQISGFKGFHGVLDPPHRTGGDSEIYAAGTSTPPEVYYIYISLPRPHDIVLLRPMAARIWSGTNEPQQATPYATGLRLLYDNADARKLMLTNLGGTPKPINFDSARAEVQLDMSISLLPYNAYDPSGVTNSFTALAKLLKLDLHIKPGEALQDALHRPCMSPVMQLARR